jgi:hypothetical protein
VSREITLMRSRRILQYTVFKQNTRVGISEVKYMEDAKL